MSTLITHETKKRLPEIGLIVLAGIVGYIGVKWLLGRLNPLAQGNLANSAVNTAYQDLTGSTGTIGTDLYNMTHPGQGASTGPSNATYFLTNGSGALVYDASGTIVQTTIPPGQPGNPYVGAAPIDHLRGDPQYIFSD